MTDHSDDELLRRYQLLGEIAALEILLERYLSKIYQFMNCQINNQADTEDLVQDVLLKIIRRINSGEPITNFKSYLFTGCRNALRDYFRYKKIASIMESTEKTSDPDTIFLVSYNGWEMKEYTFTIVEIENAIQECLAIFPSEKVRNILWDHIQDYSLKEIAERNNCPVYTAGSIWHRQKAKLFQCVIKKLDI